LDIGDPYSNSQFDKASLSLSSHGTWIELRATTEEDRKGCIGIHDELLDSFLLLPQYGHQFVAARNGLPSPYPQTWPLILISYSIDTRISYYSTTTL
jgi:hypothetical protein